MAYNYDSSGGYNGGDNDNSELISWIIVVAALVMFWPVGLFLLFRKLTGNSVGSGTNRRYQQRHPYDIQQDAAAGAGPYKPSSSASGAGSSASSAKPGASPSASSAQSGARTDRGGYNYKYEYRYQYQGGQQAGQQQSQQAAGRQSYAGRGRSQQPGMQGVPYQKRRKNVDLNKGKGMTIWGGILTGIFGFISAVSFPAILFSEGLLGTLAAMAPLLGFTGLGVVLLVCGAQRSKKAKRFRKYLALIGKRDSISIATLAQAMPVSYHTACDDLQEMLDEGYIPTGYLDMSSGRLILSDEGIREEVPVQEEEEVEEVEEPTRSAEEDDAILREIKQTNDAIADPVMSAKIDRIGEITSKILEYQRKNPNKNSQLRSFLSYYLPTTLKILKAYAQMEAQGIEGENIRAAKERIEGMMDKVVEGFEKQLDKLFQDDAMDITTDVEVLERMLDKDGLSGGTGGFTLGGV